MHKMFAAAAALAALSGCASITSESTQSIRVDARDAQGMAVAGSRCELKNDKGVFEVDGGRQAMVRKSAENLDIRCTAPSQPEPAEGTAISRAGAGMFGNALFGGGVGAIIDHNKGTAYNYPEWVQVVFGQFLVFDRTDHNDGQPTPGTMPAAAQSAAATSATTATR